MSKNNRFSNIHYLQNLIYLYDSILYTADFKTSKIKILASKEFSYALKIKLEFIFGEFNKKISYVISEISKNKNKFDVSNYNKFNFNQIIFTIFEFSDIFSKFTQLPILELTLKLLVLKINIFVKTNNNDRDFRLISDSPNKNLPNQQYIIYFFELMVKYI